MVELAMIGGRLKVHNGLDWISLGIERQGRRPVVVHIDNATLSADGEEAR